MNETLLISALSCLIALLITTIFNWLINKPKKQKEEKIRQEEQRIRDKNDILEEIHFLEEKLSDKLKDQDEHINTIKLGMQTSLKNDLKNIYDFWIKKGYAPMDAKDDLERMYQVYHSLGANGVMDAHREKFLELPDSKI